MNTKKIENKLKQIEQKQSEIKKIEEDVKSEISSEIIKNISNFEWKLTQYDDGCCFCIETENSDITKFLPGMYNTVLKDSVELEDGVDLYFGSLFNIQIEFEEIDKFVDFVNRYNIKYQKVNYFDFIIDLSEKIDETEQDLDRMKSNRAIIQKLKRENDND